MITLTEDQAAAPWRMWLLAVVGVVLALGIGAALAYDAGGTQEPTTPPSAVVEV